MVLLCNLSQSYNNLIVALKSQANIDLNIEFVTIKFFHEELKKKENEGSTEGDWPWLHARPNQLLATYQLIRKQLARKTRKKIFAITVRNLSIGQRTTKRSW
jgi:hypothetical protein